MSAMLCSFQHISLSFLWLNLFISVYIFDANCFSNFLFRLLLLYNNATGFCVMTIYFATLLNWFFRSCSFVCVCVWSLSTYKIKSSANEDNFTYFFSILIPFFCVCVCLIALARPSSIMLTKSVKNWHPCRMPDLGRKLLIFHH